MTIKGGGSTQVSKVAPNRGPAGAIVAGNRAARYRTDAIEIWDLGGKGATTLPTAEPERALAADGDAIVLVANDRAKRQVRIVRQAVNATATAVTGPSLAVRPERVIASGTHLWVADKGGLYRYALGATPELAKFTPWSSDEAATCIAHGTGVAFAARGAIVTIDAADQRTEYTSKLSPTVHLAPAGTDRVWATTNTALFLVALGGTEAKVLHEVPVAGIYHLASAGGTAFVLSVEAKAGAWSKLVLTAVGPDGVIRWHKDLPGPKRQHASVAAGGSHVVVVADDHVTAFAASDGAPIVP